MTAQFKGVKIKVSVYFAATLAILCVLSKNGYASLGLVCCVLHETGHLIFMRALGGRVNAISLGVYGMRIDSAPDTALSPRQDALIAFGGPFVNIILLILGVLTDNQMLSAVNAALAIFNLMPVESMDGYNLIYNLLISRYEPEKIKTALKFVSAVFLLLLYFLGFLILLKSRYNFTVLAVAVYLTLRFIR